jgi:hypothetical protein
VSDTRPWKSLSKKEREYFTLKRLLNLIFHPECKECHRRANYCPCEKVKRVH